MTRTLLFSNKYKKLGWVILLTSIALWIVLVIFVDSEPKFLNGKMVSIFPTSDLQSKGEKFFSIININYTSTIIGVLVIIGGMLVGFSKEKEEDEYISKLRLSSLLWAVFVNYSLLLVAFIFIYEMAFFTVMTYNMFTVLIIFIARFNYLFYKNSKV